MRHRPGVPHRGGSCLCAGKYGSAGSDPGYCGQRHTPGRASRRFEAQGRRGKSTPREAANLLTAGLFGWWGPKATGPAPANLIVWASGHLAALRGAGPALPSAPRPHQQTRLSLSPSDGRGTSLFPCTRPKISRFRQIFRRFGVAPDKCRGPRARSQSPVNRRRASRSESPTSIPPRHLARHPRRKEGRALRPVLASSTWCSGRNLTHKG